MQAVEISEAGPPDVLRVCTRPVPVLQTRRSPDPRCSGRREPARLPPAGRRLPARRRASPTCRAWKSPAPSWPRPGVSRARPWATGCARSWRAAATRSSARRPPCSACRCRPAFSLVEAAAIPETFFTVWTNVFERGRPAAGRVAAGPWRRERHRHHGDPAGRRLRRPGLRHGRQRREVRALLPARRGARRELPHAQVPGRAPGGHEASAAWT